MAALERRILSIDIGGTGVRGAAVTPRGKLASDIQSYQHMGPAHADAALPTKSFSIMSSR